MLSEESRQSVLMIGHSFITADRIVSLPRQNNNEMATPQDIYSVRNGDRSRKLAGRSLLVALLDGISPGKPFSKFNGLQQITHLLIISPSAKEIVIKYSAGSSLMQLQDQQIWR